MSGLLVYWFARAGFSVLVMELLGLDERNALHALHGKLTSLLQSV